MSTFNTKQNWKLSSSRGRMLPRNGETVCAMVDVLRNTWESTGVDYLVAESDTVRINVLPDGSIRIAMKN